jgi:hypothetical protein
MDPLSLHHVIFPLNNNNIIAVTTERTVVNEAAPIAAQVWKCLSPEMKAKKLNPYPANVENRVSS